MRSRKGSAGGLGVVDEIVKGAPEFCQVRIICEGKEVIHLFTDSPSSPFPRGRGAYVSTPPPPQSSSSSSSSAAPADDQTQSHIITQDSFGCAGCFKPRFRSHN